MNLNMQKMILIFLCIVLSFLESCLAEQIVIPLRRPPLQPATKEELQQLIQSIDLSGWAKMPPYLWTCTPSYFLVPSYNAKNDIQTAFQQYEKNKKILTKEKATEITQKLGRPVPHVIAGLVASVCHIKIGISNVQKPSNFNCYFIILDARYLAQQAAVIAENNGKEKGLPSDINDAITTLLTNRCQRE